MSTPSLPSPAFQVYPAEWLSSPSVILMTPAEEGAYFRLLCYDWVSDGLPDDDAALAALSRLGEGWFSGGSEKIRKCFSEHPEKVGFMTSRRLSEERRKQSEWRRKSQAGGVKSGESRRKNNEQNGSTGNSIKSTPPVEPPLNSLSLSSKSTPIPPEGDKIGDSDSQILAMLWSRHPKAARLRSTKPKLVAAWRQVPKEDRPSLESAYAALTAWIACRDWTKDDGQFVPGVHRWVKDRRWEQFPTPAIKPDSLGLQRASDDFRI